MGKFCLKVSVIIPAYNAENTISAVIEDLLRQNFLNMEIIVVDDGSTDNTLNILHDLKIKYKDSMDVISGDNLGIHRSFGALMDTECVDYAYIAFSDQDDIWDLDKLSTALNIMDQYEASFYSSAARLVDCTNSSLGADTSCPKKYSYYMEGNSKFLTSGAQGCTMVMSRELFNFIRSIGIPMQYGHDTWIPIISYYVTNCVYDPTPHLNYRQHGNSWTGDRSKRINQLYKETAFYLMGLKRYKSLAEDILRSYKDYLTAEDIWILSSLVVKNFKIREKLKILHNSKIGKYGIGENIVFIFYYLFVL